MRGWLRRNRTTVTVTAAVLVVLVTLSVLSVRNVGHSGELDPDNDRPDGAQAVARVLDRHGVDVTVVRDARAFADATVDQDTTVVVTSTFSLGRSTAVALDWHTVSAGALVLATPSPTTVRTLRLPVAAAAVATGDRTPAGCTDDALVGLRLDVGVSVGYRPTGSADAERCFPVRSDPPTSLVLRVDRTVPTYVVGGTEMLTNGRVLRADNAAAALRLLGQHDRLVWYVPDPL
ncbi:MAG: DUF4350 domain-containing protein, partial [Nocardioidaceae bacterium]|nr:DUF4350 domain-containing protein [Nocardioidaceae bacterium]